MAGGGKGGEHGFTGRKLGIGKWNKASRKETEERAPYYGKVLSSFRLA